MPPRVALLDRRISGCRLDHAARFGRTLQVPAARSFETLGAPAGGFLSRYAQCPGKVTTTVPCPEFLPPSLLEQQHQFRRSVVWLGVAADGQAHPADRAS